MLVQLNKPTIPTKSRWDTWDGSRIVCIPLYYTAFKPTTSGLITLSLLCRVWVQDQTDNKSQVVWVVICWKAGNFWQGSLSVNPLLVYVLFHGLTLAWGCRNFLLVFLLNHMQISNARPEFGWAEWLISKYPGERFPGPHGRGRQIRSRVTRLRTPNLMTLFVIFITPI